MRTRRLLSPVLLFALAAFFFFCHAPDALAGRGATLRGVAREAVSDDAASRASAIKALRAAGPAGLEALFAEYADEIARQAGGPGVVAAAATTAGGDSRWSRIAEALDAVSQQRDSFASRLYWYTDLEEAKRAARAGGKPILSLRLLGKLSEEHSCANSRFFRTALYPDAAVSQYLREHFVLHWKSVRPAPLVTVDFGDGRKIVRTITGNSVHYVLDAEGRPVDALPGLYGPRAFLAELQAPAEAARRSTQLSGEARARYFTGYYNGQAMSLISRLQADALRARVSLPEGAVVSSRRKTGEEATAAVAPTALRASYVALTKALVEFNTVRAITYSPAVFERALDEASWTKLADLRLDDARMGAPSVALVRRHNPYVGAGRGAAPTAAQLARVVANFERRMALDTVRNEYLLRPVLLRWLIDAAGAADLEGLNRRVYAELFLTPDTDPWLGLVEPDIYTALANDGVVRSN